MNPQAVPATLGVLGDPRILSRPLVGLLCSAQLPPSAALAVSDLARALRDAGVAVVSGFQSAGERECLTFLLRGRQPVVICPARGLGGMRLPAAWLAAVGEGRLALVSALPDRVRRPTAAIAEARNRLVVTLSDALVVLHATPNGRLAKLAAESLRAGRRVYCLDLPENGDLRVAGAVACGTAELAGLAAKVGGAP